MQEKVKTQEEQEKAVAERAYAVENAAEIFRQTVRVHMAQNEDGTATPEAAHFENHLAHALDAAKSGLIRPALQDAEPEEKPEGEKTAKAEKEDKKGKKKAD